jgi:hypothetical protein
MPSDAQAVTLLRRLTKLQEGRSNWESHWQEIADYMRPRKADITKQRAAGQKRTEHIFDGTAIHAAEMLAASLHGMLTNMATPWFTLRFTHPILNQDDIAKEWLEAAENAMYQAFQRSNFQEQVHELYDDLVCFGTATMMVESDPDTDFRFSTRHISEIFLSEDEHGRVDTVYRKFKMTARAALLQFGDKATDRIKQVEKREPYEMVEIVHVVLPRTDRNIRKNNKLNKPWASLYLDAEESIVLSESGYDEFPYVAPRWLKSSTDEGGFGHSPAMSALPDVKMVSKFSEITIRAAQKQIDPPLMVPDDGFMLPIRTVPGGLNFYRSGTRDRVEPLNIGANQPLGLQMEEQRRQAIRSAFYVDQLILAQNQTMTATEVIQRTEEKMRLLGPVLGRLQAEYLQPLILRCFNILSRSKKLPVPPEFMVDLNIEIEYVSPIAKAQRSGDVQSIVRMLEMMQPLMALDPSIMDWIDMDGLAKHAIKVLGIPASVVRGSDEVELSRAQRAEQQQAQQQQMEMMQAAEGAGKAAPAMKALNDMAEGGEIPAGAEVIPGPGVI